MRSSNPSSSKAPSLCRSAQLVSIAALAFLHMISGLVASHRDETLADGVGTAVPLERSSVALVFFVFAMASLISEHTKILPLPQEMLYMIALFAFGQEFLLFHLQRPDAGLEGRYYTLLLVPICACMLAIASSIAFPSSVLPPLILAGGLFLQGTWLFQMAFSFFTTTSMANGCSLHMRGEGDYVIKCNDGPNMALMRGKAVATLQFNCHMALLLTLMLPLYAITRRHHKTPDLSGLNYELVATNGEEAPPSAPSAFSLDVDENLDDDKTLSDEHHNDTNGFHRVLI